MTVTVLVADAGGVIASHMADAYAARTLLMPGVSRRPGADASREHLLEVRSAKNGLQSAADTTHLVFAGYVERPAIADLSLINVVLLDHPLDALADSGAPSRHITRRGGNAYGAHLGYFNVPAKERDPRLVQPNLHYSSEYVLRAGAAERGFDLWAT